MAAAPVWDRSRPTRKGRLGKADSERPPHASAVNIEGARSRSPEPPAEWMELGLRSTRTRMAGVCLSLDRDKLPGRATRLTRLAEWSGDSLGRGTRDGRDRTGSTAETQGKPG